MKRFAFTLIAIMSSQSAYGEDLFELGRRIAVENCAECHAISADDESKHPEAPPLRDLSERYPVEHLAEAFAEGIVVGHEDMPEFQASPEQINALLAYLRSIQVPIQ